MEIGLDLSSEVQMRKKIGRSSMLDIVVAAERLWESSDISLLRDLHN